MKYLLQIIKSVLLCAIISTNSTMQAQEECEFDNCDAIKYVYSSMLTAWKTSTIAKINSGEIQWTNTELHCIPDNYGLLLSSLNVNSILSAGLTAAKSLNVNVYDVNYFGQYHTLGYRADTRSPNEIIAAGGFYPNYQDPNFNNSYCDHLNGIYTGATISTSAHNGIVEQFLYYNSIPLRFLAECCQNDYYQGCNYINSAIAGCIVEFRYPCETYSIIPPKNVYIYEINTGYIPLDHIICFLPVYFGNNPNMDHQWTVNFSYRPPCYNRPVIRISWSHDPQFVIWNPFYRGDPSYDPTPYDEPFPTIADSPVSMPPYLPSYGILPASWGIRSLY